MPFLKIELLEQSATMKLTFAIATTTDAAELAALHTAASEELTQRFGHGFWSSAATERGVLANMRLPKFSRILIARSSRRIIGALRLATKKPWAIDTAYFTPADKPLYLTGMAVHPSHQRKGIGRQLMKEAEATARAWPADAIRLDAFDGAAGAGPFYAQCGYRELAHVVYKSDPLIYFELILSS
jgi:GNAT superfamily N-acetyltransferase